MPKHLISLSALAFAACSAGAQPMEHVVAPEASNTIVVAQAPPPLMVPPPVVEPLDGAPRAHDLAPETSLAPVPAPAVKPPAARSYVAPKRASVSCSVVRERTRNGTRLIATAKSGVPVSGSYSFVVTQRGSGGSSDISQGGDFDAAGNRSVSLSSSEFSGSGYRAVLTLRVDNREVCRREVRS